MTEELKKKKEVDFEGVSKCENCGGSFAVYCRECGEFECSEENCSGRMTPRVILVVP